MATAATTVEIDSELQHRVERIAEARHESTKALIQKALEEYLSRAERRERLALRDTSSPEFKAEYRRQMAEIAAHDRLTNFADRIEPDEEDLKGWV